MDRRKEARKWARRRHTFQSLEDRLVLTSSIGLTIGEVEVAEDVGSLRITLLRSGDLEELVTVDYATFAETANEETDFLPRRGTFTFKPGISGQQIEIPILDDGTQESDETLRFELSNPTGEAQLGLATQLIRILDDDASEEVGHDLPVVDNFESTERWSPDPFGTDTATTGRWEIGAPQGTTWNGVVVQPANAAEGQRALVTGLTTLATALSNDVDAGSTSVASPPFTIPPDEFIDFSFDYFFAHDEAADEADFLRVSLVSAATSEQDWADTEES